MSKILLLGNSHAAALRHGFAPAQAQRAGRDFTFWGLPGGAFSKARIGPDGLLRPAPDDKLGRRKWAQWGISPEIDLAGFDQIFLVGLRYHHRAFLLMLSRLWNLDRGPAKNTLGVSEGFLRAAIRADIEATLAAQNTRVPMDPRFTLMAAPYSDPICLEPGPVYEPTTRAMALHPQAAALFTLYEEQLIDVHRSQGLGFLLQPRDSLSAPWLSQSRLFAHPGEDARHLNAAFGTEALMALLSSCNA